MPDELKPAMNDIIYATKLITECDGGMDCLFEIAYCDLIGLTQEETGQLCGKSIPVISRKKANNKELIGVIQAWILKNAAGEISWRLTSNEKALQLKEKGDDDDDRE